MTKNWGEMTTMTKPGRIGGSEWTEHRADHAIGIYNCNFSAGGGRQLDLPKPWTVLGPDEIGMFETHAEALEYAKKRTAPSATQQRLDAMQRNWRAS